MNYKEFLQTKIEVAPESGFDIDKRKLNEALKPHQKDAVAWAIRGGRRALFESFGLGKTIQEIEFCHQVIKGKGGSKMGVGCPEYILLFRKLPTDRSRAYADEPVVKSKEEYTRAQWQIDAHGYWRSSGDRLISKEELEKVNVDNLQKVYRQYSRENVYDYHEHVELAKKLDENGKLPAVFMVVAPGSWNQMEVWEDINRMRTLNTNQSRRRQQMHVCPLQLDIVERIINRYSNEGDLVLDPFGGLMTVPMMAVKMKRRGYGIELNPDYFRDGVGYLQEAEQEVETPTLFDFI